MDKVLVIALGGALGALIRVYSGEWIMDHLPGDFPYGTMVVNCLGALLIGLFLGLFMEHSEWPAWAKYLLVGGGLGAFTTFSTFAFELLQLLMDGAYMGALAYGGIQLVGGLFACYVGLVLARLLA